MRMVFKGKYKRCKACLLALVMVLTVACFVLPYKTVNAEGRTVKVGYFEAENFLEGASDGAYKTGYGYEYLQKVSNYTGWTYEYVYADSWDQAFEMLLAGQIDLMPAVKYDDTWAEEINYPDYSMIDVNNDTYYLVVAKNDTEILDELNTALELIDEKNPFFTSDLTSKYYATSRMTTDLTEAEETWLADHPTISVGYVTGYEPFCDLEQSEAKGMLIDMLQELFDELSIDNKLVYHAFDSYDDMLNDLHAGRIDIIMPVYEDTWYAEQDGIVVSAPISVFTVNEIYRDTCITSDEDIIAVAKNSPIQKKYAFLYYPNNPQVEYDTLDDCLNAVNENKARATFLNTYRTNISLRGMNALKALQLSDEAGMCYAVRPEDSSLLAILDQGIALLDDSTIQNSLMKNINGSYTYTLKSFLIENWIQVGLTVLIAVIVIIIMINSSWKAHLHHLQQLNEQRTLSTIDELTGIYNRRAFDDRLDLYKIDGMGEHFAVFSIDINGLKQVNDNQGHTAGDELIIGAVECFKPILERYGDVYRVGGDEFISLINMDRKCASIKLQIEEAVVGWHGELVKHLSLSIGYATREDNPDATIEELIELADKQMYKAKEAYYKQRGIDRRGQLDAYAAVCNSYIKVVKANLTTDTFTIINMNLEEQTGDYGYADELSSWLHGFARSGNVHPDDLIKFLDMTELWYMRKQVKEGAKSMTFFYRRKSAEYDYRQVMFEMIKANDYTDESQSVYLYVKDIDAR